MALTTVVCLLRSGGEYREEHVARLHRQFRAHAPSDVPFLCLSDKYAELRGLGIEVEPLRHDWPGHCYWCKMEIYRIPGPALYFDLDTTIVGDLAPLLAEAQEHEFIANDGYGVFPINAGVLAWRGNPVSLYQEFERTAEQHIAESQRIGRKKWNEQVFVYNWWRKRMALWQAILPRMVMSYKFEWRPNKKPRDDVRVVFSHGHPRPWAVDDLP